MDVSWTIKKAECGRIDAFELWCWRRHLRVAWTARVSNQSIVKEINPEYSLEGLMLKLKLQYFGYLMQTANLFPDWRKEVKGDDRGWDGWMASLTRWTWVWASSGRQWRTGKPGMLRSMESQRVGHDWATEQQQWRKSRFSFLCETQRCFFCIFLELLCSPHLVLCFWFTVVIAFCPVCSCPPLHLLPTPSISCRKLKGTVWIEPMCYNPLVVVCWQVEEPDSFFHQTLMR